MAHKLTGIAIVEVNTHVYGLRGKNQDGRWLHLDEFPGLKLTNEDRIDEPGACGKVSVADAKACARRNKTQYLGVVRDSHYLASID